MVPVLVNHKRRNDSCNLTAYRKTSVGRSPHETHMTSTVYETYTATSQAFANSAGIGEVVGMYFSARSTIDSYTHILSKIIKYQRLHGYDRHSRVFPT